jgi:hypothetical protein
MNIFCFLFLFGLFEGKEEEEEEGEEEIKINTCLMCVCVYVCCCCVWHSLYRPFIQAQRGGERCLGLYTHMRCCIYTLAIISFASPNLGVISSRPPGHRKKEERRKREKKTHRT